MATLPDILNDRSGVVGDTAPVKRTAYRAGHAIYLLPAGRTRATEAFGPLWLAPKAARIVSVGRHDFLPLAAVAWINDRNEIEVAVESDPVESGRSVLIRVYTRDSHMMCRAAVFQTLGERSVAGAVMGSWDGLPVAGMTLLAVTAQGDES